MLKTITSVFFSAIFSFSFVSILIAQDANEWTQFRGNDRNGISHEKELLNEWPETGLELIWKQKIGDGFSEICISNNVMYTLSSDTLVEPWSEYVGAYNMETGEQIWRTIIDSIFIDPDGWGNGPRTTPAIDDEYLYSYSSYGKLVAVAKADGKVKWTVDFMKEFGSRFPRWGFSNSPLLIDEVIITEAAATEERGFVGIDKNTGKTLWTKGIASTTYNSPALVTMDGKKQVVFVNDTMLYSFDKNGEILWTHRMPMRGGTSMVVYIEPNKFFVSTMGTIGSFLMEVNGTETKEAWTNTAMQNHWSSSVYFDGHVYGFSKAKLQCISLEDGNEKWSKRGFGKGSLIFADGKLLVLSERGMLKLIEANPEMYVEKGSFQALDGKSWTAPSLVNGIVYLRNLTEMAAYKIK